MGYLVCDKCEGYYELEPGESPDDFSGECECGGNLIYSESLEPSGDESGVVETTIICPHCGTENPEDRKLCQSCKRFLKPIKKHSKKDKTSKSTLPPYTASSKSSDELINTWNKQSTPIKAISILGICCIGLILIAGLGAMISPDKTTSSNSISPTTPVSAMSESEYRIKGASWCRDMESVTKTIANIAEGYSTKNTAASELDGAQSTTKRIMGEMQSTTPPAKFSNIHQNLLGAVKDTDNAITMIKTGIESESIESISQAVKLIKSATNKVESANDELETL